MPTPIPVELYPLLMDLINQTYLDRVERIDGAQVDDSDNIICAATDGRKALAVRVTDSDIDIRLRQAKAASPQFAAPDKKKKKCVNGISCGDGCISAAKTCRKKTTPKQKAQKQKIVTEAKKGGKAKSAKSADIPKTLKSLSEDQEYLIDLGISASDKDRMEKIVSQHPDITAGEAAGFAAYIGDGYEEMNMTFWMREDFESIDPDAFYLADARANAAALALAKMPVVTKDSLNDEIQSSLFKNPLASDGLTHSMKLDDPDEFVGQFEVGKEVSAGKFLSTSWVEGGNFNFSKGSNVEFKIKPKLDGSGAGRLVDKYKKSLHEDEILYPPDARFRVTKVEKEKGKEEVSEMISIDIHTEKYETLSRIRAGLSSALSYGVSPKTAKNYIFDDGNWTEKTKDHKLPTYPKNKGDAKSYLDKIDLLIEEEAKKKKPGTKKVVHREATADKYTIYKEEI